MTPSRLELELEIYVKQLLKTIAPSDLDVFPSDLFVAQNEHVNCNIQLVFLLPRAFRRYYPILSSMYDIKVKPFRLLTFTNYDALIEVDEYSPGTQRYCQSLSSNITTISNYLLNSDIEYIIINPSVDSIVDWIGFEDRIQIENNMIPTLFAAIVITTNGTIVIRRNSSICEKSCDDLLIELIYQLKLMMLKFLKDQSKCNLTYSGFTCLVESWDVQLLTALMKVSFKCGSSSQVTDGGSRSVSERCSDESNSSGKPILSDEYDLVLCFSRLSTNGESMFLTPSCNQDKQVKHGIVPHIDSLFMLMGQSNMAGRGELKEFSELFGELDNRVGEGIFDSNSNTECYCQKIKTANKVKLATPATCFLAFPEGVCEIADTYRQSVYYLDPIYGWNFHK